MTANLLTDTLVTVVAALARHDIPYALAGGLAFSALAEPRATTDIDLICLLDEEHAPAVFRCLQEALPGLIVNPQVMRFARATIRRAVYLAGAREVIIDLITAHDRVFMATALERGMTLTVAGQPLRVVTPEDLIVLKTWAGRPQDALDIAALRARYGTSLDEEYLCRWLGRSG